MDKFQQINNLLNQLSIKDYGIKQINNLGEVSETFKIVTKNSSFVLKINSKEHLSYFQKEKWCLEEGFKLGISVPKPIIFGDSDNFSYLLQEFVDGENCFQLKDTSKKKKAIQELGYLANILANIVPQVTVGDLKGVKEAEKWFYDDYLQFEINQTSKNDDYLLIDEESRKFILISLVSLKNYDFDFVLCHGDLSVKNCLYNQDRSIFTLVDFGSAETNVKDYYEIMLKWLEVNYDKTLNFEEFKLFIKAITNVESDMWLEKNMKIIYAFAILYTLDKYRYAHDKNKVLEESFKNRFFDVLNIVKNSSNSI